MSTSGSAGASRPIGMPVTASLGLHACTANHEQGGNSNHNGTTASTPATPARAVPRGGSVTANIAPKRSRRIHLVGDSGDGKMVNIRHLDGFNAATRSPLVSPTTSVRFSSAGRSLRPSGAANQRPRGATRILDFLFLGGVHDAQDAEFIARNHIKCIVNVSTEEYWSVDRTVEVVPFRVEDHAGANIAQFFGPTREVIERVRQKYFKAKELGEAVTPRVLVHCQQGRSRSPTVVLAYLIYRNGWSVAEALQYVSRLRPCIDPNIGFIEALRTFQESMDSQERGKRYSQLSVVVRNLSCVANTAVVQHYFEQHVGLVRDVVMHHGAVGAGSTAAHGKDTGSCGGGSVKEGGKGASHDTPSPPASMLEGTESSGSVRRSAGENHYSVGAGKRDAVTEDRCVSGGAPSSLLVGSGQNGDGHAASSLARSPTSPSPLNSWPSGGMRRSGSGSALVEVAKPQAPTLCMVFFVCFENVKIAKEYVAKHHQEFSRDLGPAPGKVVKLLVPSKIKAATGTCVSRTQAPPSTHSLFLHNQAQHSPFQRGVARPIRYSGQQMVPPSPLSAHQRPASMLSSFSRPSSARGRGSSPYATAHAGCVSSPPSMSSFPLSMAVTAAASSGQTRSAARSSSSTAAMRSCQ